jgi:hypothetical protein
MWFTGTVVALLALAACAAILTGCPAQGADEPGPAAAAPEARLHIFGPAISPEGFYEAQVDLPGIAQPKITLPPGQEGRLTTSQGAGRQLVLSLRLDPTPDKQQVKATYRLELTTAKGKFEWQEKEALCTLEQWYTLKLAKPAGGEAPAPGEKKP